MNRRRFLELLGTAALGSGVVYSFPSVIVPKNIAVSATGWNFTIAADFLASDGSKIITSMWMIPLEYALSLPADKNTLIPAYYERWKMQ